MSLQQFSFLEVRLSETSLQYCRISILFKKCLEKDKDGRSLHNIDYLKGNGYGD